MGNMIGTVDDDLQTLRYSAPIKKGALTATAMGRYSTPNLAKKKSSNELRSRIGNRKSTNENVKLNEFNSKIYKDIFPPPNSTKTRNTMIPIFSSSTCILPKSIILEEPTQAQEEEILGEVTEKIKFHKVSDQEIRETIFSNSTDGSGESNKDEEIRFKMKNNNK